LNTKSKVYEGSGKGRGIAFKKHNNKMTNNEKAHYIIDLIKVITIEIEEYPMRRKQLLLLRSHLEKAVRLTGTGMYREFKRPESLPLVSHEKALPQMVDKPKNIEPSSSIADNIPEPTRKSKRK
jgi:hypothetical protein